MTPNFENVFYPVARKFQDMRPSREILNPVDGNRTKGIVPRGDMGQTVPNGLIDPFRCLGGHPTAAMKSPARNG